jgi:hypothetical protein
MLPNDRTREKEKSDGVPVPVVDSAAVEVRDGQMLVRRVVRFALAALAALVCWLAPGTGRADEHGHIWSSETCEIEQCEGRCCAMKCYSYCTVCLHPRITGRVKCSGSGGEKRSLGPLEPRAGLFAAGGATGSYDPHEHDLGPLRCGPWSKVREGCEVRHCTRQCRICRGNFDDDFEARPSGCF